jgi:tetratricopeptide (TPR) repeat protein
MTTATFTEWDLRLPSFQTQPDAKTVNRAAIASLSRGNVEGALNGFREAAALDADFAEAWNNSGLVLQMLGRFVEAVADFDQALAIRTAYAEALTNRGRVHQALGDATSALADFDRALACVTGPFAASIRHNRGALKQDMGDLDGALADYDEALRIDPNHSSTYVNRGAARKDAGDLDGALADLEEGLTRLPRQEATILHKRGGVRVLQNDFAGAVADYDRALALEPENVLFYISRGNARYHLREARGVLDYRMAFRINPEAAAREIIRMLATDVRSDAGRVIGNCDKHLRINDRDLTAHARRGLTLTLLDREAEAAAHFALLRVALPDMGEIFVLLIQMARAAGQAAGGVIGSVLNKC